jgi:Ca2+-binding RTX toxin-like protein
MTVKLGAVNGAVTITGNTHSSQTIGLTHAVVGGSGADTMTGNNLGDTLNGGGGADKITGGTGNDIIIGGAGNDILAGGGGNDAFVFRPNFGQDTVSDFSTGTGANHDMLDLRGLGFTDFSDVLAHTDPGANAVIHAPLGLDQITLSGINKTDLHDFNIVV